MSSSRGCLNGVIHGEILHLGCSEDDILVWFLDRWDVLFWRPISQMMNGESTQSMDRAMGIPSRLCSHGIHLTRGKVSFGTTGADEDGIELGKDECAHHWTTESSTRGGQCPQGYPDIVHRNGISKRLVFCQNERGWVNLDCVLGV